MNTLAVTVRLATLALTAALGSTAFAQTAGQDQAGTILALNEAPLIETWEPTLAATGEKAQARSVERELVISAEEISDKLNEKLEAKMARKLELAI
ncbi:hypothetical protein Q6D67_16610 [Haliea sp. E1-2-M8]|uniref:hypothetical protein n=1 Tax=Haliea sp. E1-2-M8 TaxID=3064706 RepID=UPI00271FEAD8|nr:hypothetical protein [Haliea sp. E1-2-M8]MDO8863329.1 hypothetical protein [Haliea sp. E1-2-M8]